MEIRHECEEGRLEWSIDFAESFDKDDQLTVEVVDPSLDTMYDRGISISYLEVDEIERIRDHCNLVLRKHKQQES